MLSVLTGMLLRTLESDPGRDLSKNIKLGGTLSNDQFPNDRFHYGLSNPPFGRSGKKDSRGRQYRIHGEGLRQPFRPACHGSTTVDAVPAASGQQVELPEHGGGRAAIVLSGSPFSTEVRVQGNLRSAAGCWSRTWWDVIVCDADQIFFRTGIGTYLWVLSNKSPEPTGQGSIDQRHGPLDLDQERR